MFNIISESVNILFVSVVKITSYMTSAGDICYEKRIPAHHFLLYRCGFFLLILAGK
jgi:hypothetical protein